jgi:hypothetical protein
MSWIGVESADEGPARRKREKRGGRQDWLLRLELDGRTVEARLIGVTEGEAHRYAQRLSADYFLEPVAPKP